jgi:hypothetical protein
MATIEVEVYLDEFDDKELIAELKDRGYSISKGYSSETIHDAAWRLSRGEVDDALHILSRILGPGFRGLADACARR